MKHDRVTDFEATLTGQSCFVRRREYDWIFDLSGGVELAVSAPWRIVSGGRIAFSCKDDGQKFGLTSPVDGELVAYNLLGKKPITEATLHRQTADLTLHFGETTRVDVFNNSMAFEGWQAYNTSARCWLLVAMGGGELAFFDDLD